MELVAEVQEVTLTKEASAWEIGAHQLSIVDQPTYELAASHLLGIKALLKRADEIHDPSIAAAHKAHKAALAAKSEVCEPLRRAEETIKRKLASYATEQRRIQAERERLAREEAERLAAEEIEAAAVEAESQGASVEEVAAIIEQPIVLPRVAVAPTLQRASGVSTSQIWKAEVFSIRELCRAIAEGRVPESYVAPNMTALNGRARSDKQHFAVPGVRAVPETSVRVGGR